jgi:hypothetical protein
LHGPTSCATWAFTPTDASRVAQQAHLDGLCAVGYPESKCGFVSVDQLATEIAYTTILDLLAKDRGGGASRNEQSHPSPLRQLPADIADYAGRSAQTENLLEVLSAPGGYVAIAAIDGTGGLGKTALAVHVAHGLTARYPDAQVVIGMAGNRAAALGLVIEANEPKM